MRGKKFWSIFAISCTVLMAIQVILYLLAYIELFVLFGGLLVLLLAIPLSYAVLYTQTRYQHSKTVKLTNKIAYIAAGALVAPAVALFSSALIALTTGWAATSRLGAWGFLFIMYVVAPIIGASITYWIGKRRDFMPYV
jgi:hypothetical protein